MACINLDWSNYGDIIVLPKCHGLFTGRRNQSTKGVCVDIEVRTYTGLPWRDPFPYLASNLYISFKDLVAGKYYYDCYTFDGSIISREVIACKYVLVQCYMSL